MRACCWVLSAVALWGLAAAWPATVLASTEEEDSNATPQLVAEADPSAPSALERRADPLPRVLSRRKDGSFPQECAEEGAACIPKCCPLGYTLNAKVCVPTNVTFDPFLFNGTADRNGSSLNTWTTDSYSIVVGIPCREWYVENYTLIDVYSTGLLIVYDYEVSAHEHEKINASSFCLDYSERDTEAIVCWERDAVKVGFTGWLYTSGMLVSVSGLLLTLIVYLVVEALRDLHGKSLICHVGCLTIAYILLAAVQANGESGYGRNVCRGVAFAIQFFLLSSFLWLHIMCLDAFWCVLEATGSSPVPYPRAKKWVYDEIKKRWVTGLAMDEVDDAQEQERRLKDKMVERRVFAGYSVYVWVLSLLPVLAVVTHNLSPTIPATYVDHNMKEYCNIDGVTTEKSYLYFYPFTAIFIVVNIIIFICILIKAVPFKWNATGPHRVPKQKARMVFLLFVLMSSNWVIDLISWTLGGKPVVWVMLHAFYILQGLITFLIFVLEERVKDRIIHKLWPRLRRINKKYGCCHRAAREEEATALRDNGTTNNKFQSMGWVTSNP